MKSLGIARHDEVGEVCPYSDPPFEELTDDHVFPEFLGGRRSIRVCRDCNSRFGHSFEGRAAKQLKRLQIFVSHFGLDLSRVPATWPSALVIDNATYDLKSGPTGTQYELARPLILRNEAGHIIGGRARSRAEAEQTAANMIKKGKAKEIQIEEVAGESLDGVKLSVDLSYNEDLYKFSAKVASDAAILMGFQEFVKESGIARYLHGSSGWGARIANCDTSSIRALRPQVSHAVYVEFGPQSYAIVILFGGLQVYVPLPAAERRAILGFLDPISGEESFNETAELSISPPPKYWTEVEARAHLEYTSQCLTKEAIARGATRPPDLSVPAIDLGAPVQRWVNGTHRLGEAKSDIERKA